MPAAPLSTLLVAASILDFDVDAAVRFHAAANFTLPAALAARGSVVDTTAAAAAKSAAAPSQPLKSVVIDCCELDEDDDATTTDD